MASSLREHPLWKDDAEEDFNWAVEALEKYELHPLVVCLTIILTKTFTSAMEYGSGSHSGKLSR